MNIQIFSILVGVSSGLTELIKQGIGKEHIKLISLLIPILTFLVYYIYEVTQEPLFMYLFYGIVASLTSNGLYDNLDILFNEVIK